MQLELTLEDLEAAATTASSAPTPERTIMERSGRRLLPADLPRENVIHQPTASLMLLPWNCASALRIPVSAAA